MSSRAASRSPRPRLTILDEFGVNFLEQRSHVFELRLGGGRERVEEALVLAGDEKPSLHPELVHRVDESEAVHQHPDRAHDARPARVDRVRGCGDVVAAGCSNVGDHRVQRRIRIPAAQANHLVADVTGMDRAAARAVDAQDDTLGIGVLERGPEARDDPVRIRVPFVADRSAHVDECAVRTGGVGAGPLRDHPENGESYQEREPGEPDDQVPSAGAPLLGERHEGKALEHFTFPAGRSTR